MRFLVPILCVVPLLLCAQSNDVPAWAQPGSATHTQVAPPTDFHRPSKNVNTRIGMFDGQSDIGSAIIPGSADYDAVKEQYTINSAGYNIWYQRDEFHFLWKQMSGNISIAADISFPDTNGYGDRKAVIMIRQDLDDDSKEAFVALHGEGMIQLAERPDKNVRIKDMEYRIGSRGGLPGGKSPDDLVIAHARRIGIEKNGDSFSLFVSMNGEPMHPFGAPVQLHLVEPFYVGVGFCSHLPDKSDTAIFSKIILRNYPGEIH
jgi:hypothetical protein